VGLIIAAPLLAVVSYHWLYWGSLLPMVAVIAYAALSRSEPRTAPAAPARLDLGGAALMAIWILALLGLLSIAPSAGLASPTTLGLGASFLIAAGAWVAVELRSPSPLVDLRLMCRGPLLICFLIAFLQGYATMGAFVAVPLLIRTSGDGAAAAMQSGLYLLPMGLAGTLTAPLAAAARARIGSGGTLALGLGLITAGLGLIALVGEAGWPIPAGMGLMGAGIGFALSELMNAVCDNAPSDRVASASNLIMVLKSLGSAIGAQASGSFAAVFADQADHGLRAIFVLAASASATAILLGLWLAVRPRAASPAHP
jgi:hypothetical protein